MKISYNKYLFCFVAIPAIAAFIAELFDKHDAAFGAVVFTVISVIFIAAHWDITTDGGSKKNE